jgi:hypothetical protein
MTTMECPKHGGSFDCTPFCPVCAGDQEYREPNIYGDMPPSRFRFGRSHFGGQPYAECECGATFVLFTDDGDLVHDCPIDSDPTYECHGCGRTVPEDACAFHDGDGYCRECCADN